VRHTNCYPPIQQCLSRFSIVLHPKNPPVPGRDSRQATPPPVRGGRIPVIDCTEKKRKLRKRHEAEGGRRAKRNTNPLHFTGRDQGDGGVYTRRQDPDPVGTRPKKRNTDPLHSTGRDQRMAVCTPVGRTLTPSEHVPRKGTPILPTPREEARGWRRAHPPAGP
jgi:hypothetical protein